MRRKFHALALLLLGVLIAPGIYLIAAGIGAWLPAPPGTGSPPGARERIYLMTTLLHSDIAIPVDDALRARFAHLEETGIPVNHPELRYLVFGWGSRAFYTTAKNWSDIRPGPLYQAVTGDASVMHVYAARDVSTHRDAVPVDLPPGGTQRLLRYIENGFVADAANSRPMLHIAGIRYGDSDAFYAGSGSFDYRYPCNLWVAEGLRAAGLATGRWTPTTHALLLGLRRHSPDAMPPAGRTAAN